MTLPGQCGGWEYAQLSLGSIWYGLQFILCGLAVLLFKHHASRRELVAYLSAIGGGMFVSYFLSIQLCMVNSQFWPLPVILRADGYYFFLVIFSIMFSRFLWMDTLGTWTTLLMLLALNVFIHLVLNIPGTSYEAPGWIAFTFVLLLTMVWIVAVYVHSVRRDRAGLIIGGVFFLGFVLYVILASLSLFGTKSNNTSFTFFTFIEALWCIATYLIFYFFRPRASKTEENPDYRAIFSVDNLRSAFVSNVERESYDQI